jgi:biopolymer transport protein ExbB
MGQKIWELFQLGGPVMWPLLAASITGLALIVNRIIAFASWHQPFAHFVEALGPLVVADDWDRVAECVTVRGPFSCVTNAYLQHRHEPKAVREDVLRREGLMVLGELETGLRWLAMLAQISTLLGLLGTFDVMIMRFGQGQMGGAQVQPAEFSSAIWEALLTTMYGLLIAVPCSATYQLLEGRVDKIARQMDILASYLNQWRREGRRQRQAARRSQIGAEFSVDKPHTLS